MVGNATNQGAYSISQRSDRSYEQLCNIQAHYLQPKTITERRIFLCEAGHCYFYPGIPRDSCSDGVFSGCSTYPVDCWNFFSALEMRLPSNNKYSSWYW